MTRYMEVREVLAQEIAGGHYAVGGRFPTDGELCTRFSVSRHTVREALRHLQQEGILERIRGSGTVVARHTAPRYTQAVFSLTELDNYAQETRFESVMEGLIVTRQKLAEQLGCETDRRWLRFAGLRYLGSAAQPLCWTEVYLTERVIPQREEIKTASGPFFERLRTICGLVTDEVEQQIGATALSADVAARLGCEAGTPAVAVRRRYSARGETPFEISLSLHPADRYVSVARLSRREAGISSSDM